MPGVALAKPSLRQTLIRNALQYSAGTTVGMVASIARVGLTARFLSNEANGVWLALQLLISYGANLHFGTADGLFRNVPLLKAKGEDDAALRAKRTTFTFITAMALIGGPIATAVGLYIARQAAVRHVVATVALVVLGNFRSYYTAVFKGESRFREFSTGTGLGAFVALASLPLIVWFKLDGVLAGMLLQGLAEASYLAMREGMPRFGFQAKVLVSQLKVGLATLGTTLGTVLLRSIDRTVMLERCGVEATGLYYLGANIAILMPTLAIIPFAVLTPRFFERAARGEDLHELAETPMRLASYLFAVVVGGGALAVPPVVALIWPHLAAGNDAARAAIFGTYPVVLAGFMSNVYYAINKQLPHIAILLVSSLLGFGLALLGVRLGFGITGAAVGSAVAMFAYFGATVAGAYWVTDRSPWGCLGVLGKSLFPAVCAVAAVVLIDALLGRVWPAGSLVRGVVAEAIFLVAMSPFLLSALRIVRGRAR